MTLTPRRSPTRPPGRTGLVTLNVSIPSRLEAAKQSYVDGRLTLAEFEALVDKVLAEGAADDSATWSDMGLFRTPRMTKVVR